MGGRRADDASALDTAIEWLSGLPSRWLVIAAIGLVGLIGFADWVTGPDVSCNVGYMIPVFLAATGGRRASIALAAVAAATWSVIEMTARTWPYSGPIVPYWNCFARFAVLSLVAALASTLTVKLARERGLSRTDALTGLPNARAFHEAVDAGIARMERTGESLTAAYVDVDDFKAVNDALGHAGGDEVLVLAAGAMAQALPADGVVARIGGDEFAMLLPGITREQALARLRAVHAGLAVATAGRTPAVGFSIGAVTFSDPPRSGQHLITRADRVMYGVKQHGKNTVWAEPAEAAPAARS
jgi:diguanylate cyclase (GGDEF)-like protein